MRNRNLILTAFVALAVLIFAGTGVRDSQAQIQSLTNIGDDDIPVVNYDAPPPVNTEERGTRESRGRKYDGGSPLTEWEGEPFVFDLLPAGWPAEEALPVQTSDLIVTGTVVDSEAFLSNDKTRVYSEFQIYVKKVLKQDSARQVYTGSTVTVERVGGRVSFPSGQLLRRGELGHDLLTRNAEYVLFLRWDTNGKDYVIVTGYKITNDTVYPVDGYVPGSTRSKNFEEYKNTPLSGFMSKLGN